MAIVNKYKFVGKKIRNNLIIFALVLGFVFVARFVFAADFGTEAVNEGLNNSLASGDPRSMIGRIINIALGFLGAIAVLIIIYGGFVWMTSNGEEEKVSSAKKILRNGVIGLIIILCSWAIATFLISRLSGDGGGYGSGCTNGEVSYCGCGGSMVCYNGSWGSCVGSDCGGIGPTSCDSSPNPGCQAVQSICADQDYCDDSDCSCKPRGNLGDPCDADLNTPTCEADNNRCAEYLSCDDTTCLCFGPPVITGISPVGGFCQEDFNKSCLSDDDCSSTCNQTVPNGAPDNFVTIFGSNFGEYLEPNSQVIFLGTNDPHSGRQPIEINPECINTWRDDQIVIAVPSGVSTGAIKIVNRENLEDATDDDYGPVLPDFEANDIVRPGLCYLDPNQGLLSSEIGYQGINLYSGSAYFGNYDNKVRGLDSDFNYPAGLSGTSITPNIRSGESSSFVINNINGNQERSNYLRFDKTPEEGEGPYIISFSPQAGTAGQYVTIKGDGFGGARGNNHVYFETAEASYTFPVICANSVWRDEQIIVKVPSGLADGDYIIKIALGDEIIDTQEINPNTFEVDSSLSLKTSLCRIEPNRGPIASPATVYGEYFGLVGSDGTVQFSPGPDQKVYGEIEKDNEADLIEVEVPAGAITGPVKVIKNSEWGNELNFEVGECLSDEECDTQVCCPQNTYKKGRCVNSLSDCFIDIPTSVFEWSFNTGFGNATSTPFDSCAIMADYYGGCQQGIFCPNVPGICSPYAGGGKQIVANCDYSCDTISGCGGFGSSCNYDVNSNKCIQEGQDGLCSLPQEITYTLGETSYEATMFCNASGYWEINTTTSCPEGWIRYENNRCVNESENCSICEGELACELIGTEGRCISSTICPVGSVCEDNPVLEEPDNCVVTEDPNCDCCCRIGQSASDCCSPLECTGICGEDTVDDGAGYGRCSGCALVGSTQEEHDAACNCTGHSGQYCDISSEHPEGICVDCSGLKGQDSCDDHSSVCCFDSNRTSDPNDDYCRGGSGEIISNDPNNSNFGYCAYYNCEDPNAVPPGDPAECASSTPIKVGLFEDIESCEVGCANNPGGDYCSIFNGQPIACMAESICCFDQETSECYSGNRIEFGQYEGYCAYYDCEDPTAVPPGDPTQCNLEPDITGRFTNIDTCTLRCASNDGGVGQACINYQSVNDCDFEICSYPGFACLDYDGSLGTYPDCGICCCDPSQPDVCQTPQAPDLYCNPDKGSCSGPDRGLCCGCTNDLECGNQATVGCGSDSCCQARPEVLSTLPENGAEDVCRNAVVKVDFNQAMDFISFTNNVLLFEEREYGDGICPPGTFVSDVGDLEEVIKKKENLLTRLTNSIRNIFKRFDQSALADEPSPDKLYCAIPGAVSEEKIGSNSTLVFAPSKLLAPETTYYFVVKGDEDLNSQSGVLSIVNIGFNGLGFDQGGGVYKEGGLIQFNGLSYENSHIIEFSTLSDQGSRAGVCAIDNIVVSPDSYLFNKSTNDLNENDNNPNSSTFDTKADRDKVFAAWAYSSDSQPLQPISGYYWDWLWDVGDINVATLATIDSLPNNKVFVNINDAVTDDETKLWTTINMNRFLGPGCNPDPNCVCAGDDCSNNCCNIYSTGDGLSKSSDLYVFICNNPWPPVNNDGNWYPWFDNCDNSTGGACSNFNYKFYYCRDAGDPGTLDDLPAIINQAVIRGQSDSLVCSADKTPCDTLGLSCGPDKDGDGSPDGVCIWNILKESYFFREVVLPAGEITDVIDKQVGEEVEVYWRSAADQVSGYKIYYSEQGRVNMLTKEVNKDDVCQLSGSILNCQTTIDGLINNQAYIFKLSVISENNTESQLSSEKSGTPTDQTLPNVPVGFHLDGSGVPNGVLTFLWDANTDDTLFYRLYRGVNSNQYGESFDSLDYATTLVFDENQFSIGSNYFTLSAIDANDNESSKSAEIEVIIPVN